MSIEKAIGNVFKEIVDQITDNKAPQPTFKLDVTDDIVVCKFEHMPKPMPEYKAEIEQLIAAWIERRVSLDR